MMLLYPPVKTHETEYQALKNLLEEFEEAEQIRQGAWEQLESVLDCREHFKSQLSAEERRIMTAITGTGIVSPPAPT